MVEGVAGGDVGACQNYSKEQQRLDSFLARERTKQGQLVIGIN
jgi:hypothetical protein